MLHFHLLPSPSLPAVRAQEPTLLCPSVKFQHLSQKTQIPVRARPSRGCSWEVRASPRVWRQQHQCTEQFPTALHRIPKLPLGSDPCGCWCWCPQSFASSYQLSSWPHVLIASLLIVYFGKSAVVPKWGFLLAKPALGSRAFPFCSGAGSRELSWGRSQPSALLLPASFSKCFSLINYEGRIAPPLCGKLQNLEPRSCISGLEVDLCSEQM